MRKQVLFDRLTTEPHQQRREVAMKIIKKIAVLSIVLAGFSAALIIPQTAAAQASSKCTGTWVHHFSGGLGKITMQFNANGSYQMVNQDTYGNVFTDAGRYSIVN